MQRRVTITQRTHLPASPAEVWAHVTAMPSINREMAPWLRMSYPAAAQGQRLDGAIALGQPLFTSWILLFGIVPVERMRVTVVELEPGRRFVEQSGVLLLRFWRHERRVEPAPGGCLVEDTLTLAAPIAALAPVLARAVAWFFAHRHRQLGRIFGRSS